MSGHSKWTNIKHIKARKDIKRGKIFTKLIREITIATQLNGEEVKSNSRLRTAIEKALVANIPKNTISRAVKHGIKDDADNNLIEVRYEGYGPNGVAVIVDCLTDNKNRTVSEVRHVFSRCGGNLGIEGSVVYLFKQCGLISFSPKSDEKKIMEIALGTNVEDIIANDDGCIDVITLPEDFEKVRDAMKAVNLNPSYSEVTLLASTAIKLYKDSVEQILRLTEMLEDLDDVQNVYSNADYTKKVL